MWDSDLFWDGGVVKNYRTMVEKETWSSTEVGQVRGPASKFGERKGKETWHLMRDHQTSVHGWSTNYTSLLSFDNDALSVYLL